MGNDFASRVLPTVNDVTGVVLAGGRSSRFGSDKASALLLGEPLLQWVVRALGQVCSGIVVVAARGQALPPVTSALATTVVSDEVAFQGPLSGLLAGLRRVETEWAFVTSCDAPLLQPKLVALLRSCASPDVRAVCPRVGGRTQPLSALYRTGAHPEFQRLFDEGERRPSAISARLKPVIVDEVDLRTVDPTLLSFLNANTPAELAEIAELARALKTY